jgi:hypothetical protein
MMVYFGFYFYCVFFFFFFYGWVLVSMAYPFYRVFDRVFVLIIAAPVQLQPLQGGCSFSSQIGVHISIPAKGLLLLTGLKTQQRVVPLINTNLVLSLLCAYISLASSKVDGVGIFFILLGLKIYSFPFRLLFWHSYISFWIFCWRVYLTVLFCNPTFVK